MTVGPVNIMQTPAQKPNSGQATPEYSSKSVDAKNHPSPKPIRKRDRSGANFRKRWRTLVKTGCELHQDYGARIYFSISLLRTRKDFVFRSGKEVSPILPGELVNNLAPCDGIYANDEGNALSPTSGNYGG